MKVVLKLKTGELMMGDVAQDITVALQFTLTDPMIIDRDGEGMKMRDPLIFSTEESIVVRSADVVYGYYPIPSLAEYHTKSVVYNKTYIKPNVSRHIKEATEEIEEMMQPESNNVFTYLLKTVGGGTVH